MTEKQKQKLNEICRALKKDLGLEPVVAITSPTRVTIELLTPADIVVASVGLGWDEYFEHWWEGSFEDHMARKVSRVIDSQRETER